MPMVSCILAYKFGAPFAWTTSPCVILYIVFTLFVSWVFDKDMDNDTAVLVAARASRMENQDAIDASIVNMLSDPKEVTLEYNILMLEYNNARSFHLLDFRPKQTSRKFTFCLSIVWTNVLQLHTSMPMAIGIVPAKEHLNRAYNCAKEKMRLLKKFIP